MAPKRVTISHIADEAGVHRSTVSLALRGDPRIPEETRGRIQSIAAALGYLPNLMARALSKQRTNTVGLLIPKLRDDFYVTVVAHQEEWLRARNITPILFLTRIRGEMELPAIDELVGRGADGLVFNYFPSDPVTRERVAQLVQQGIPVSMFGNRDIEGVDFAFYDTIQMGYEVIRHLISLGHRRIATLTWSFTNRRMLGYRRALEEAGIGFDPELVFLLDYSHENVADLCRKIMSVKEQPTAIFAYDDDLAAEVVNELIETGHRVPDDVSVAGFDDSWFARLTRVALTTMRLPQKELGETLVEMLFERIEKGAELPAQFRSFTGELVVRASTGPPARG